MDAEIILFMTKKDQADFLTFAKKYIDSTDISETACRLVVGECELLLTPSKMKHNVMVTGKFEIRLGPSESACKDQERAKKTFRKLRNYIKKQYWSRLAYINKKKKNQLTPSRNHWLGPDAKTWKDADAKNHVLKLSQTSWMEFEIGI
jgi:hypothetical protein